MKYGTGGLNIDGCRVRHSSQADFDKHKAMVDRLKEQGGSLGDSWKNSSDLSGASDVKDAGRWPPNAVMSHSDECRKVGSTKAKAPVINRFDDGMKPFGNGAGHDFTSTPTGDENGEETLDVWQCQTGCPIGALDEQSGERKSTLTGRADPDAVHGHPGHDTTTDSMFFGKTRSHLGQVYADSGGASRFHPQFQEEGGEWQCQEGCPVKALDTQSLEGGMHSAGAARAGSSDPARRPANSLFEGLDVVTEAMHRFGDAGGASRFHPQFQESEEWECGEGCPVKALDGQSGELRSGAGDKGNKAVKGVFGRGTGAFTHEYESDSGGASRFHPQFEGQTEVEAPFFYTGKATRKEASLGGKIENTHPTKKPLKLMQWLVRLVTPKGGIVLDPYCGSGSTLHAAVNEGMRFTGIDNWDVAFNIASKRMAIVCGKEDEEKSQEDVFDLMGSLDNE